jgi:hypothetical protein
LIQRSSEPPQWQMMTRSSGNFSKMSVRVNNWVAMYSSTTLAIW